MKRERVFVHVYFSNETVFPDNSDDWTNKNVSFGARNFEANIHSFMLQTKHFHWSNRKSCLNSRLILKLKHARKNVHASLLNANGSIFSFILSRH